MGETGTTTKVKAARVAAGSGAILSLGASLVATAAPAGAASFEVTTTADSGPGSLRQAILDANGNGQADTITFAPGLGDIQLTSGQIAITEGVTITDPEGDVLIDATDNSRIFYIDNAGAVTISGITLQNGSVDSSGGAVISLGTDLTVADSTISTSFATDDGGGIFAYRGTVTVTDATFTDNASDDGGGGLFAFDVDTVTIAGSTFTDNNTDRNGGGVDVHLGSSVTVTGSTFTDNLSDDQGGGLSAFGTESVAVSTSTFDGNLAGGPDNFAIGGGLAGDNVGSLLVDSSTFTGNEADAGGGLVADNSPLTVVNSTFSGNTATGSGGGIALYDSTGGDTLISHSTITGNTASIGGGLFVGGDGGTVTLDHDIIEGNVATGYLGLEADEPTLDDAGEAIFVADFGEQLPVALDSVTLTNSLVNGSIAGVVVDGGGNQFEVPANLGPLADNGGPTQTHDLLAGSAALDAGDAAFAGDPTTDQRGLPRVSNGRIDIGAVEVQVQEPVEPPVTPPATPAQPVPAQPDFTG